MLYKGIHIQAMKWREYKVGMYYYVLMKKFNKKNVLFLHSFPCNLLNLMIDGEKVKNKSGLS